MELKQALQIIKQVGAIYRGTFEEHQNIQNAIKMIENELNDYSKK
jgi:hypothetical protein